MVSLFVLFLVIVAWAFLPKVAIAWSQAVHPWHVGPWQRADVARRGLLGVQTGLKAVVWPAERAVAWARFLVVRLERTEDRATTASTLAIVTGVVGVVGWAVFGNLTVAALIGATAAGVVWRLGANITRSDTAGAIDDDTEADGDEVVDSEPRKGLTVDFRPCLAIAMIALLVWILT